MFNYENKKIINKYLNEEMSFDVFINIIKKDKKLLKFLSRNTEVKERVNLILKSENYDFINEVGLYYSLKKYYNKRGEGLNASIIKIYNYLIDNLPDWFDGYNINFLYKIYKDNELDFNDLKSIELYHNEIAKHFKFDDYPPKFLTSFDWPEMNNIPLCFKEMIEEIKDDMIIVKYYFYESGNPNELITFVQQDYR